MLSAGGYQKDIFTEQESLGLHCLPFYLHLFDVHV